MEDKFEHFVKVLHEVYKRDKYNHPITIKDVYMIANRANNEVNAINDEHRKMIDDLKNLDAF